ncbi:MAG: hypothetical protein SLAVMIC_00867 [uncultured marine phage]|uniref:Uncharacterized protein n=1 Tax=uncultured marine phage TaxID=707152 RepID=A0A8D9FRG1_9VIRU|nr:MAG: hypothetical protein SLAVMIC_00867 [uncultured marine phage]
MKLNLGKIINCNIFKVHNWTCKAQEGIDPTPEQVSRGKKGFIEYSKMYCKTCGKESKLNKEFEKKLTK